MKGGKTNGGHVSWLVNQEEDGDCSGSGALVAAGAVLYARTTQPQSVMHLETSSNIYRVTVNPWNTDLTPGGSSGGESALLAMKGSILLS